MKQRAVNCHYANTKLLYLYNSAVPYASSVDQMKFNAVNPSLHKAVKH